MNIQKFTQKSIEAINGCEKLAYEYGNQEIEQEHLLLSLKSSCQTGESVRRADLHGPESEQGIGQR